MWNRNWWWSEDLAFLHVFVKVPLSLSFCPCGIPQGMSHSWIKNTEPCSWTPLAIHLCETACFLIKASTSHPSEVKKNKECQWECAGVWMCGMGCVSSHVCLSFCIYLQMYVDMYLVCLSVWINVCRCKFQCVEEPYSPIASTKS